MSVLLGPVVLAELGEEWLGEGGWIRSNAAKANQRETPKGTAMRPAYVGRRADSPPRPIRRAPQGCRCLPSSRRSYATRRVRRQVKCARSHLARVVLRR